MCLIAFAWKPHPTLHLLVAANRDEFHERPTAALARWTDHPEVLAGRDLQAGGGWLGVSEAGRMAAVTNIRLPGAPAPGLRSRGELVSRYLVDGGDATDPLGTLPARLVDYGPCNLLMADRQSAMYLSNRPGVPARQLEPGVYGLSNAALDTPWPKTVNLRQTVSRWLAAGTPDDFSPLLAALSDETTPADEALPDTGVGLQRERFLGSAFIRSAAYGTRCSTVIAIRSDGQGLAIERRFGPDGVDQGQTQLSFRWPL